MPKKFPSELRRDVVAVARRGALTITEVAADFDVSPESVRRWMRQADVNDGVKEGLTTAEHAEVVLQKNVFNRRRRWRTRAELAYQTVL